MAWTLRLSNAQEKKLSKIKTSLNLRTNNKAVGQLVDQFEADQKEIAKLRQTVTKLENSLYSIRNSLQQKQEAEKEIEAFLKKS